SESILTSIDVFVVINILSNRSKWTFYFLSSVQFNFTIGENMFYISKRKLFNYFFERSLIYLLFDSFALIILYNLIPTFFDRID
ncbi:hypothetical protein B5E63_04375, partial [Lactobacillus gallinarum]